MDANIWLKGLFKIRGIETPDSRPLYAYRLSDVQFVDLQNQLTDFIAANRSITPFYDRQRDALFCLFAAEWWKRNYIGGPWSWEPILDTVNLEVSVQSRNKIVTTGLRFWKRALLNREGRNLYLATIVCEGGLPLQILHNEATKLTRFFKNLISHYHNFSDSTLKASDCAEAVCEVLPVSLRNKPVFELCGDIVEKIFAIKKQYPEISEKENAVEYLDSRDKRWRKTLPLNMGDRIVEGFLKDLVNTVGQLKKEQKGKIKLLRFLRKGSSSHSLVSELHIPKLCTKDYLDTFFRTNLKNVTRYQLFYIPQGKPPRQIARLYKRGVEEKIEYKIDSNILKLTGSDGIGGCSINLTSVNGDQYSCFPIFSNSIKSLPLFFSTDESGQSEFLGSGSFVCKRGEVLVIIPDTLKTLKSSDSKLEKCSDMPELEACLYHASGKFTWQVGEEKFILQTGQKHDHFAEYQVSGRHCHLYSNEGRTYRGNPELFACLTDDTIEQVPPHEIFWRPVKIASSFRPLTGPVYGQIELAHISENVIWYKTTLTILPSDFELKIQPKGLTQGEVSFKNIENASIKTETDQEGVSVSKNAEDSNNCSIICQATKSIPGHISINLSWPNLGQTKISVPFPVSGTSFVDPHGLRIKDGGQVSIEQLYGVKALGMSSNNNEKFNLFGKFSASDISKDVMGSLFIQKQFSSDFRLIDLKQQLMETFAASVDLDASVKIQIDGGVEKAKLLRIARFDIVLTINNDTDEICLDKKSFGQLNVEELEQITLLTMPFADPDVEPIKLEKVGSGDLPIKWSMHSQSKSGGAWIIFGHINGLYRVRPRNRIIDAITPEIENDLSDYEDRKLKDVISTPDTKDRHLAYQAHFNVMLDDPNHCDWAEIIKYIKRFQNLPFCSFDLFTEIIKNQEMMALLLFQNASKDFSRIWSFRDATPFSWLTVPIKDWISAARKFRSNIEDHIKCLPEDLQDKALQTMFSPFFERFEDEKSPFTYMIKKIRVELQNKNNSSTQSETVVESGIKYLQKREWPMAFREICYQDLIKKHCETIWPIGPDFRHEVIKNQPKFAELFINLTDKPNEQKAVLDAPVIASITAQTGLKLSNSWSFAIKNLRDFDKEWFDSIYQTSLTLSEFIGG